MSSDLREACTFTFIALSITGCCGGGCPDSPEQKAREVWERELEAKATIPLAPTGSITVKRDVHNFVLSAEAANVAQALSTVLADPERHFGLIKIDRLSRNIGKPFTLGERFQGRYQIDKAIEQDLPAFWRKVFGDFVDDDAVAEWLCRIENQLVSDYGEVTKLEMNPEPGYPHMFTYEYLEGTPIAGSSTFEVIDVEDQPTLDKYCQLTTNDDPPPAPPPPAEEGEGEDDEATPASEETWVFKDDPSQPCKLSRLTQIFIYQEQNDGVALFFSTGGLKLHNQVLRSQAEQTVSLIEGASILESDIVDGEKP